MLACKILAAPPVILYPVEFTVELWKRIKMWPASSTISCSRERVLLKSSWEDNTTVAQHSPPNRQLGFGTRLVFLFWLSIWHWHWRPSPKVPKHHESMSMSTVTCKHTMSPETLVPSGLLLCHLQPSCFILMYTFLWISGERIPAIPYVMVLVSTRWQVYILSAKSICCKCCVICSIVEEKHCLMSWPSCPK